MENIQNIYDTNIKSILGANLDYFRNFRQDIIKNFILHIHEMVLQDY